MTQYYFPDNDKPVKNITPELAKTCFYDGCRNKTFILAFDRHYLSPETFLVLPFCQLHYNEDCLEEPNWWHVTTKKLRTVEYNPPVLYEAIFPS